MANTKQGQMNPAESPHISTNKTSDMGITPSIWDATSDAPVGPWKSVDMNSGSASMKSGAVTGEFEDGPGKWRQT